MSREFGNFTERLTSSSPARMKMKAFPFTLMARSPHGKSSCVSGYFSAKARRSDSIFEVAFIQSATEIQNAECECRMKKTEALCHAHSRFPHSAFAFRVLNFFGSSA